MKKILLGFALAVVAFSSLAFAETKGKLSSTDKALMQIEQELLDAFLKSDWSVADRYLAHGFVFTAPDGSIQDRAQWFADAKTGAIKIESSKNDDMKVHVYADAAIVTYRSTDKGTYKGNDISGQYRWTDVFLKRGGRWQIVSTQGTPVPKQ